MSGFGYRRARVGLGYPKFVLKPVGLKKFNALIFVIELNGFQKSPRALVETEPGLYRALDLCSAGPAMSPGLRARA